MDDSTFSGESSTATPAENPALNAARAELTDIATNPQNARYVGYHRGDSQVSAYLDGLYKKALPTDAPGERDQGVSLTTGGPDDAPPTLSPEDAQSVEVLRQEWGDSFETHLSEARYGATRLAKHLSASVDDLTAAVLDAGGDLKLILKIASHFEQRMRGHERGSRP